MARSVRGWRGLLNGPGHDSTAALVAEIEDTRSWKSGRFRRGEVLSWDEDAHWNLSPDVTLQISDCQRSIIFSIGWETASERRNALRKVDRLILGLSAFREALEDEQSRYLDRVALAKKAGPPKKDEQCASV